MNGSNYIDDIIYICVYPKDIFIYNYSDFSKHGVVILIRKHHQFVPNWVGLYRPIQN